MTIPLSLFLAALLSPAAAQTTAVAPLPAAVMAPWGAAIGQTLRQFGGPMLDRLGAQSLLHLGSLGSAGPLLVERTAVEADPALASRLVARLRHADETVEAFASLPLRARMDRLKAAALEAEREASQEADSVLARARELAFEPDSAGPAELEKVVKRLAGADAPYVAGKLTALTELTRRLDRWRRSRMLAQFDFMHELPASLEAGGFDTAYLREAFGARLDALRTSVPGPWQLEELQGMENALGAPEVREALAAEGREPAREELGGAVAAARDEVEGRLVAPDRQQVAARLAMRRYFEAGRIPAPERVKWIAEYYLHAFKEGERSPDGTAASPRALEWMTRGDGPDGYPSLEDLGRVALLAKRRADIRIVASFFSAVVSWVGALAPLADAVLPGPALFAAFGLAMTFWIYQLKSKLDLEIALDGPIAYLNRTAAALGFGARPQP